MATNEEQLLIKIGANLKEFNKALKLAEKNYESFYTRLAGLRKKYRIKSAKAEIAEAKKAAKEIADINRKAAEYEFKQRRNNIKKLADIKRREAKKIANIKRKEANKRQQELNNNKGSRDITAHRPFLDSVAVVAKYGAISQALYGIQTAFGSVIQEAGRFNQSIADIGAVLQKNREDAAYLAKGVTDLSVKYGEAVDNIQEGMLLLGRAGVEDVSQLTTAMEGLAAMSIITGDSMGAGAAAMASMLSVFEETQTATAELVNNMTAVANATRLGLQDFTTISNYALTSAKAIGMNAKAYLAMAGAMSRVGLNASTTGTSIRRFLKIATAQSADMKKTFLELGISQKQFVEFMSQGEEGMVKFGKVLLKIPKNKFQDILPNQVQLRATFTTLREIAEKGYITKMYSEMDKMKEKGQSAFEQAGKAALGYQRALKSLKNAIAEMFNQQTDSLLNSLLGGMTVEEFDKVLVTMVENVRTFVRVLSEIAAGVGVAVVLKGIAAAYNTLTDAAKRATFANKAFSRSNLVILAVAGAIEAWYQWTNRQSAALEKLKTATSKSSEEIAKMGRYTRLLYSDELTKGLVVISGKIAHINNLLSGKGRGGRGTQISEERRLQLKAELEQLEEQKKAMEDKIELAKKLNEKTDETNSSAVALTNTMRQVEAALSDATMKARALANALRGAALAFNNSLVALDAASGKVSTYYAEMYKYQSDLTTAKKDSATATQEMLNYDKQIAYYRKKAAENNNPDIENQLTDLESKRATAATKVLESRRREKEITASIVKAVQEKQASTIRNNAEEAKLLKEKEYLTKSINKKGDKTLIDAKKRLALANLDVKKAKDLFNLKADDVTKEQRRLNLLSKQNEALAAEQALQNVMLPKKQKAAKASKSAAKAANKAIKDAIALRSKQLELENALIDLETARNAILMTRIELNQREIRDANQKVEAAKEAYEFALKESKKLTGGEGGDKARKKVVDAQIKLVKAKTDLAKAEKKLLMETKKSIGSGISGALKSLIKGDYKAMFESITSPMEKAFNDVVDDIGKAFSNMFDASKSAGEALSSSIQSIMDNPWMTGIGLLITALKGGLFNSGTEYTREEWQKKQGIQTSATNDGVTNLLGSIDETLIKNLGYSKGMYENLSALVVQTGKAAANIAMSNPFKNKDAYTPGALGGIWGSKDVKTLFTGLELQYSKALGAIANIVETTQTTKTSFFGFRKKTRQTTTRTPAEQAVVDAINAAYEQGFEAISNASKTLGVDGARALIDGFNGTLKSLDFEGKSSEEIQAMINSAIGQDMDAIINQIAPFTKEYMKAGETLLETYGRLAYQVDATSHLFDQLGLNMKDFGTDVIAMSDAFIEASGGISKAMDNMSTFIERYYSDAEKAALQTRNMQKQFRDLGVSMPQSMEAFRRLVETTTDPKLLAALLGISGAFADMEEAANALIAAQEERKGSELDYLKEIEALRKRMRGMEYAWQQSVASWWRKQYADQYQSQLKMQQAQRDFYDDILKRIRDAYTGNLSYMNSAEKANYLSNLASTQTGKDRYNTLAKQLEYEKKLSISKEEYAMKFDRYINELKAAEPEATTDDVVDKLDILIEETIKTQNAIGRSSYQKAF